MDFWKMNGAGNDFLIINNMDGSFDGCDWSQVARILCERHMSIGGDGIIVVEKATEKVSGSRNAGREQGLDLDSSKECDENVSSAADFKMCYYNADGSLGEMCGNGARCICRYGYENGLAGETQTIETTAGIVTGRRISERSYKIRLNDPTTLVFDKTARVNSKEYQYSYVELGRPGLPHAVVAVEGLRDYPERELFDLGRTLRYHEDFPKGTNINFYEIISENHLFERTYERGVEDFTYACGTGTGSVVAVLTLQGKVSGEAVKVTMTGGDLLVDIVRDGDKIKDIYLTGPTNIVAKGIVTDEDLRW